MTNNARKYNLSIGNTMSCGIGSCGTIIQCSLLDSFDVVINGSVYSYPELASDDLKIMDRSSYNKRVCDFLSNHVESPISRDNLLNESEYYDPSLDNFCYLNQNFIVYEYLEGFYRIINIGDVLGDAQYKVYPLGSNPENYIWSNIPTVDNLSVSGTYVFEVRDFYNGEEYCKVSKVITIYNLIRSTTI
jgi:hypothetical protein